MDDPRNIWQTQEVEEMRFSVEELRAKADKFQRRIWRRNLREYLAALFVIVFFAATYWNTHQVVPRIAFAWIIAWSVFYIWYMWRWGSATPVPANMGNAACVGFYRNELARQRDLLRSVWRWVVLPIVPGLALLAIWKFVSARPEKLWQEVGWLLFEIALLAIVAWLNVRAARRLDRRISELDRERASA
jgi:hypothetical protein